MRSDRPGVPSEPLLLDGDSWAEQVVDKVTGRGRYPADEVIGPCLYAAVVRSSSAHAEVVVDTTHAAAISGVVAIAGREAMGLDSRVKQVGDVVAGVVATSQGVADRAAAAIVVSYDDLPRVCDPESAAAGVVQVSEHFADNVVREVRREHGDVTAALANSAFRLSADYETGRPVHFNLALRCCYATVAQDGSVHLLTSVDAPYFARHELAAELGIPDDDVVVAVSQSATSSFGGRTSINSLFEPFAVRLARLCPGIPVRLAFTADEELTVSHTRHSIRFRVDAGCDATGRLTALQIDALVDHGPFPSFVTDVVLSNCRDRALDLVAVENYRFTGRAVLTHNPTAAEMRGIGVTQIMWVLGSHVDELARVAGIDTVDFLRLNLAETAQSQESVVGSARTSVTQCLDRALAHAQRPSDGHHRERTSCRHGWGVAAGLHTSGLGTFHGGDASAARIWLTDEGGVELAVAAPDSGQGSSPAYRATVAHILGMKAEDVRVSAISTDFSPYDRWGSVASRGAFVIAPAVAAAARDLRDGILSAAAVLMGVEAGELTLADGYVRGPDGQPLSLPGLVARTDGPIDGHGTHQVTTNPATYGVCLAEVCVDVETGTSQLLRAVTAFDLGHVIDEAQCHGQLAGAFSMGWEYALGGELSLRDCQPTTSDPYDVRFARAADLPQVETILIEAPDTDHETGGRGVGTPAIVPVAPALCNAVRDATGVRLHRIPGTAEDVLRALEGAR